MLGADGCVEAALYDDIGCCPPPLCGNDLCCTFVAFFNLLPSGPLWDYWKAAAISYFENNPNPDPALCPLITDPRCPSIVLHAIYTVLKLRHVVHNGLWVALRESSPYTAVTTLDNHLARLQWEDCYAQHCRKNLLGEITPYEIWTECGPLFCPPEFPEDLTNAVKRGIAIALSRTQMGVIKNLCTLNWIIDPLGAVLTPILPEPPPPADPPCDPYACNDKQMFLICHSRDWIEGVGSGDVCETHLSRPHVQAFNSYCHQPAGLPSVIWPGVLAAECIVRSLINCPDQIKRCC